jgi:DUF1016 N-terminal domain
MTRKTPRAGTTKPGTAAMAAAGEDEGFDAIVRLIDAARQRAFQAVNTALIELYWQIGEHISRKIAAADWGDGVVDRLAAHIARTHLGLRGFTRRNLFRMRQFYEAYQPTEFVPPLVAQIPWTHHLVIMEQSKPPRRERSMCGSSPRSGGANASWSGR